MNMDTKLPKRNKVSVSILVCFNIVFALCGGAILFLGFLIFRDIGRHLLLRLVSPESPVVTQLSCSLLAIGAFSIVVAILGCCSAARKCHIAWYIFCVILVVASEFGLGIGFYVFNNNLTRDLEAKLMLTSLREKYGIDQSYTQSLDFAQHQFKCCGVHGDADYDNSIWKASNLGGEDIKVPWTCCILDEEASDSPSYMNPVPLNGTVCQNLARNQNSTKMTVNYLYKKGCSGFLDNWLKHQTLMFIGMGFSIWFLQIAALLAACCLCRRV